MVFVVSSSLILGVVLGIILLLVGETTMNLDIEFDFGQFDGLALMFGLPVLSALLFLILSPISYFVHQFITARSQRNSQTSD